MSKKGKNSKKGSVSEWSLNIWNKHDFAMCGLGEKDKLLAKLRYIGKCLKWSRQRITRGFADCDLWDMDHYLQKILPAMLQEYKDTRHGSPVNPGGDFSNTLNENVLSQSYDDCHAAWDKILGRMIFLWRESDEETCSKKNPYEEEYDKAFDEFNAKYGTLGKGLQTEAEREEAEKGRGSRVHFMSELPEYKDISDKYDSAEREFESYRDRCKDEAMDLMKKYFWSLWD